MREEDDDLSVEQRRTLEETLVDEATASLSISELEGEILILEDLEKQAKAVVASDQTGRGMNSRRSFRTNRRCAMPLVVNARSCRFDELIQL